MKKNDKVYKMIKKSYKILAVAKWLLYNRQCYPVER